MPAALVAVGGWIAGSAAALTGGFITGALIYGTITYAFAKLAESLVSKDQADQNSGLEAAITQTDVGGFAIVGFVRCAGVNVIPPLTGGDSGRYLEQILAHAIHEVDGYLSAWVDDTEIDAGDIVTVSGGSTDGLVTTGKYDDALWIRRYTGTASQTVDFILNNRYPTAWSSNARGRGIAYSAMTYDWGEGKIYSGIPVVTQEIRGAKLYDPRLDSTNGGSGSHRVNDPTTWEYSNNPSLGWAWYAMALFGGRVSSSKINWPSVAAAADICDELVNIPSAATQKRYTFNGRFSVARDWRENAKLFVDAMLGRMTKRGETWYIYAGAYDAPTFTVAKSDWLSIDSIKTVAPRDGGRWNTVRCWFTDPERNWQREECFPRRNATYKSADGAEEISIEIEQPACTNEYEAQRKAELLLRQSRNQIALVGTLPPRFRKIATGEMGAFTFEEFGWVSKLMRVRATALLPDGSVRVSIAEEQEADWDDLAAGDYNQPSISAIPAQNPTTPSTPPNFTVTPSIGGTLVFTFGSPLVKPTGTEFQIIRSTNSANAAAGTTVWQGNQQTVIVQAPTSIHWYYGRTIANSYVSAYSPNTFGIAGLPFPVMDDRSIPPDPEFMHSRRQGDYWGFDPLRGICSLSPTGGIASDNGILVTVPRSTDVTTSNLSVIFSLPHSPYPRYTHGRLVTLSANVKVNSYGTNSGTNYVHNVGVWPWNGVGTPSYANNNLGDRAAFMPVRINSTNGSKLTLGTWYGFTAQNSLSDLTSANSYPYLVAGLQIMPMSSSLLIGAWSGDQIVYDQLAAFFS
jgi:hypothetical protein